MSAEPVSSRLTSVANSSDAKLFGNGEVNIRGDPKPETAERKRLGEVL